MIGLAVAAGLWATPASADDVTIHVKSSYPYIVYLEFYSTIRNAAWPGGTLAYKLDDYETKRVTLSCRSGEKICYGAWTSDRRTTWGVGRGGGGTCRGIRACCFTCGEGDVSFTLVD